MPKINHYENLNLLISKALAHGADSKQVEENIREDATNMYVQAQQKIVRDNIEDKIRELTRSEVLKPEQGRAVLDAIHSTI